MQRNLSKAPSGNELRVIVRCHMLTCGRSSQGRLLFYCRKGLNQSWNTATWISRMCREGGGLSHASRFTTSRDRCSPQICGAQAFHCKELPRVRPEAKLTKHVESRCKWKIYFNCYLSRNVWNFCCFGKEKCILFTVSSPFLLSIRKF